MIYSAVYHGGELGGGGTIRGVDAASPFEQVIESYSTYAMARNGEAAPIGRKGVRLQVGNRCVAIFSWRQGDPVDRLGFEAAISADIATKLDGLAESYIEIVPDDCDFRG